MTDPSDPSAPTGAARPGEVPAAPAALLRAEALRWHWPGTPLIDGVSITVGPGVALVRGGDGRGKTTLLRLLAGTLAPQAGRVEAFAPVWLADAGAPEDDGVGAGDWLERARIARAPWDATLAADLVEAFALGPHLDKALFRLSTGSRRKLALVAAFAGGTPVVLLDAPFAALDGPSRAVLGELLAAAVDHRRRAWIVADHECPRWLEGRRLAGEVDLGE
ncbi:MAG: hypothetical protein RJA99_2761 [Pseudomonadota bacterium]|jgi:ABC-type multidrug transport system ATPase subunit